MFILIFLQFIANFLSLWQNGKMDIATVSTIDEIFAALKIDPATVNYTITIVSPEEIRELNKTYRGRDAVTDVLSFPFLEISAGEQAVFLDEATGKARISFVPNFAAVPTPARFPFDTNPATGRVEIGDIVINETEVDRAFLAAHSVLHLLGYHHGE
jgi:probable rRNA maturation factor